MTEVEKGSMAETKGLQPGSILTHVNKQVVENSNEVRDALKSVKSQALVPIRVLDLVVQGNRVNKIDRILFLRKK